MAKFEDLILRDTYANRPAYGTEGRLFYATDYGILYRDSGSAWEALLDINSLTADASPNAANDYVVTYDASAAYLKKVLLEDLPGATVVQGGVMTRTTAQTITDDTETAISFATEVTDDNGYIDISGNPTRFTAPAAGWYQVGCHCTWDAPTGGNVGLRVRLNGTTTYYVLQQFPAPTTQNPYVSGSITLDLSANDYVEFYVLQDMGSSNDLNHAYAWILQL